MRRGRDEDCRPQPLSHLDVSVSVWIATVLATVALLALDLVLAQADDERPGRATPVRHQALATWSAAERTNPPSDSGLTNPVVHPVSPAYARQKGTQAIRCARSPIRVVFVVWVPASA